MREQQLKCDFYDRKDLSFLNLEDNLSCGNTSIQKRGNQDKKTNNFGVKLLNLCKQSQLLIVNGRTIGDFEGKYTSFQFNGCSTVDYSVASKALINDIISFQVLDPTFLSDHAPIRLSIRCNYVDNKPSKNKVECPRGYKWDNYSVNAFSKALQTVVIKDKIENFAKKCKY